MPADLAILNANIETMNPYQPKAEAVAIKSGKIIKVGTSKQIRPLIGKTTKTINLNGKTVLPGLIDTHVHVADFGRCLMWLDLTGAQSVSDVQALLAEKTKQTQSGRWIVGRGWNHNRFKEKRMLTSADLDVSSPDNPVILYHEAAMIAAANSKAIQLAGITLQTHPPEGGAVDKDPQTGKLSGIFRDTATNLVWQAAPEPDIDELTCASAEALQKIAEAGLTSVHWLVLSETELPLIQRLKAEGKLKVRVNIVVPEAMLSKTVDFQSDDPSMLHLGGVAVDVDGYLDSKTAALCEPYSDEPANNGKLLLDEQALAAAVRKTLAVGLQPVIHAMGDKAVDITLRVIEKNQGKARVRIEQAALLNKTLLNRLKLQDVVISVQPKMIPTEFTVWLAMQRLGVERAKWLHPLKTLKQEGIAVAGGSDCPMEPLNPLLGIQEAVVRLSFPEQQLTVQQALSMYTTGAAYSSCEEKLKGTIEESKLADFTVLLDDPAAVDPFKIKDISVEMTIVNGIVIFSRGSSKQFSLASSTQR